MTRENEVKPSNLIYPLFFHTKDQNEAIASMPGCERHTYDSVMKEVGEAVAEGVSNIILFPKVPEELKTNAADECYNPEGMVPKMISRIKEKYGGQVNVWTDVALDPYSDQGHDGMVSQDKRGDGGKVRLLCISSATLRGICWDKASNPSATSGRSTSPDTRSTMPGENHERRDRGPALQAGHCSGPRRS